MKFITFLTTVCLAVAPTFSFSSAHAEEKSGFSATFIEVPKGGVERTSTGFFGTVIETPVPSVTASDVVFANLQPPHDTLDGLHRFRQYHCQEAPRRQAETLASAALEHAEHFGSVPEALSVLFQVKPGCVLAFSPARLYGSKNQGYLILGKQDTVVFSPFYLADKHLEGVELPLAIPYLGFREFFPEISDGFGEVQNPFQSDETFPVAFSRPLR